MTRTRAARLASPEAGAGASRGRGESLPAEIRSRGESSLGISLSQVRLHRGPEGERIADSFGAKAITRGESIALGPRADESVLAHELVHVAQNRRFGAASEGVSKSASSAEVEARNLASLVQAGDPVPGVSEQPAAEVQRDEHQNYSQWRPAATFPPDFSGDRSGIAGGVGQCVDTRVRHASDIDPCLVQAGSLTNLEMLDYLGVSSRYLRARSRGQDRYYDYANLMQKLVSDRNDRIKSGHIWLAGEDTSYPGELFRIDTTANGMMAVTIVSASNYNAPGSAGGALLMRPGQFNEFLARNDIPRMDVATFYANARAEGRNDQLQIMPPPLKPQPAGPDYSQFLMPPPNSGFGGVVPAIGASGLYASPFDMFARSNLIRPVYSANVNPNNPRSVSGAQTQWRGGLFEYGFGYSTYSDTMNYTDLNRVQDNFRVIDFAQGSGPDQVFSVTHSMNSDPAKAAIQLRNKFARMTGGDQSAKFSTMLTDLNTSYGSSLTQQDFNNRNFMVVPDDQVVQAQNEAEWLLRNQPNRIAPLFDAILPNQNISINGVSYTSWNQLQSARTSGALSQNDYNLLLDTMAPAVRSRVTGAGVSLAEIREMMNIRIATQGYGSAAYNVLAPPEVLEVRRMIANGVPENEAISAVSNGAFGRGATMGGAVSLGMAGVNFARSGFDSKVGLESLISVVPGTLAGGTQSYLQSQWNARLGGEILTDAMTTTSTRALGTALASRVGGASAIGGPVSALTTIGTMALEEGFGMEDFTDIDYTAKGTRAFVSGGIAAGIGEMGALGTALAFSAAGSEVPIAGNIAGFIVGLGAYFVVDGIWGDDIEADVRQAMGENGCVGY